jgi:hypothetical protein
MLLLDMTAQDVGRYIFGSVEGVFQEPGARFGWGMQPADPPFDFAQGRLFVDDNRNCNSQGMTNCEYRGDILVG